MLRFGRSLALLSSITRCSSWVTTARIPNNRSIYRPPTTPSRRAMTSTDNNNNNNDEVAKAIAAAAQASVTDAAPTTIFDKIIAGDIPSDTVYEDEMALAFRDIINPEAPVHILVIPKDRQGLTQVSKAVGDNKATLGHLLFVAGQIGAKECPQGFRLVINDGSDGAQSVYHLHIHILGGRQMAWPPG